MGMIYTISANLVTGFIVENDDFSYFKIVKFPLPFTKDNWHQGKCDCSKYFSSG